VTPSSRVRPAAAWAAFLVAAFALVGLMGVFATYAAPLPVNRALLREAALDDALAAAHGPDPQAALERLRDRLDDSASAILPAGADFDARVAQERTAMRARFTREAAAVAARLRWEVVLVTLTAAAFGVAMLYSAGRG
jgi:hypothetical protein